MALDFHAPQANERDPPGVDGDGIDAQGREWNSIVEDLDPGASAPSIEHRRRLARETGARRGHTGKLTE